MLVEAPGVDPVVEVAGTRAVCWGPDLSANIWAFSSAGVPGCNLSGLEVGSSMVYDLL